MTNISTKAIGLGIAGIVGCIIISTSVYRISGYERGVIVNGGRVAGLANPGLHFRIPILTQVERFPTDTQNIKTPRMNTMSVDNQEITAQVDIQFELPPESLEWTYQNNRMYRTNLENVIENEWKVVAGGMNISEFSENRQHIADRLFDDVSKIALKQYHIHVSFVGLTDVQLDPSYRRAQTQANLVKTHIEQAQGEQQEATIRAETSVIQTQGQAKMDIEKARGQAQATKLQADAEAYRIRVHGEAEADAQQRLADAISKSSQLVSYEAARHWNGMLPQNMYASTPLPFIKLPAPTVGQ